MDNNKNREFDHKKQVLENRSKVLIGAGGWAREVSALTGVKTFYVDDQYVMEGRFKKLSELEEDKLVMIAIADPKIREDISMRINNKYFSHISRPVTFYENNIIEFKNECLGIGSIIAPGCIITTNVKIGNHAQLNIGTIIGHDVRIGNYFTTAPNIFISGNVTIGNRVYMGAGSHIREKINICDNVTIGMGAMVVNDITIPGTYVGIPAKLKKGK